ncbi:GNAT family N-acetyltransferase, partial [Frankia gtarii]|uniref:GNAT family N-acetyltransferase n=1 Tax=Frankia gtarii TaxID=2950102 RepID=UPI0021BF4DAC
PDHPDHPDHPALAGELRWRRPRGADQARVLAVLDDWWGGFGGEAGSRQRALLLPRLFFQHFANTCVLGEAVDGRLTAFLIAFRSAAQPDAAYIHFVGVDPALRRRGVAAALYRWFFAQAAAGGARRVEAITSPGNATSVAFHTASASASCRGSAPPTASTSSPTTTGRACTASPSPAPSPRPTRRGRRRPEPLRAAAWVDGDR